MQSRITICLLLNLLVDVAFGQGEFRTTISTANGMMEFGGGSLGKKIQCNISPTIYKEIGERMAKNQVLQRQAGKLPSTYSSDEKTLFLSCSKMGVLTILPRIYAIWKLPSSW